ncbi:hypothetical protein K402DRAFT_459030 [Aulographum hederae CBS 113979]|uniref:Uncharacterized protein n=1 Tax=Aulographum hederae CBS 113979 TaxID=1176131 RepID=A0A6G1HEW4_9PEZI|nr:hypothetical protein K402DRAFT_459030 [Aulographum hederae CBS 113979]
MDPSGPSQPTQSQAYTTPGNPATHNPSEAASANATSASNAASTPIDHRVPQTQSTSQSSATESSLGRGVHGAGDQHVTGGDGMMGGREGELDAAQMAAPGEGDIRDAVAGKGRKSGASGGEQGLEMDLERKKKEQAPAREAIKEKRGEEVDVGGVLGQRGGPANPVD